jgi:hypothetical protein
MSPPGPVRVVVSLTGRDRSAARLTGVAEGLRNRSQLHADLAREGVLVTKTHISTHWGHATAQRLGATPSGYAQKTASTVRGDGDDQQAVIRIPRSTGVGRAFRDIVIRPGSGKTYLTIPACARTYGKTAGDFGGQLAYTQKIATRTPMLIFHDSGEVAFWLRRKIEQKQNRQLLPSDVEYADLAAGVAEIYVTKLWEKESHT